MLRCNGRIEIHNYCTKCARSIRNHISLDFVLFFIKIRKYHNVMICLKIINNNDKKSHLFLTKYLIFNLKIIFQKHKRIKISHFVSQGCIHRSSYDHKYRIVSLFKQPSLIASGYLITNHLIITRTI